MVPAMTVAFYLKFLASKLVYLELLYSHSPKALLVDMEEGVVCEMLKGPLKNLYDARYFITDVSGSGNNWAVGNLHYGHIHHDELADAIRKSAELCDYLQCFFILHSMGGGTGSGVGTHILKILADEYPDVYRMDTAVFPSMDDDVITSPYNTVLALNQLSEFANCVMPIDNMALTNIIRRARAPPEHSKSFENAIKQRESSVKPTKSRKPFDEMNNIVANMLLNLTSSSRFEGTMNVDLNEISMNLVPFPRLHYLIAAQSPLNMTDRVSAPRKLDQIFADAFTKDYQLMSTDPCRHVYMAAALLVRGAINATDIHRNIEKLRSRLRFVPWNREGWKVGHCLVPPVNHVYSLLALSNNTSIHESFSLILERFYKLYRRKAHLHHYTSVDGFDASMFESSVNSLQDLVVQYIDFEKQARCQTSPDLPRLEIMD
uniref:Tubulin domain-containing protein n=1 Tax=Trichobilharzia regenti TaxID=157069 RepID=A0AA85K5M9_TRIRE|nr:unnamed protein product [Trichobilharzia regenti]